MEIIRIKPLVNQKTARNFILLLFLIWAGQQASAQVRFEEVLTTPPNVAFFEDVFSHPNAFDCADVDGDNDIDILITGGIRNQRFESTSKLYLNDGSGSFYLDSTQTFEGEINGSVALLDVDGDNDADALITGDDATYLYVNNGAGSFSLDSSETFVSRSLGTITGADVDGDNDLDVLITGHGSGAFSFLYINDGSGNFSLDSTAGIEEMQRGGLAFVDVDNDNDLDILIVGFDSNQDHASNLYINDGAGNFSLDSTAGFEPVTWASVAFADVDGDNDQDVLITGKNSSQNDPISHLYLNDGTGNFSLDANTDFTGVALGSSAFVDVDNDNDSDVLITGRNDDFENISSLYLNDGAGNFSLANSVLFDGFEHCRFAFADFDGDTDLDLFISHALVTNAPSPVAKFYRNITNSNSVAEVPTNLSVSVYPNPSNGLYALEFLIGSIGNLEITITDVCGGQFVCPIKWLSSSKGELNLSEKKDGIYYIHMRNTHTGDQKTVQLLKM